MTGRINKSFKLLGKNFICPINHPINDDQFKRFKNACNEEVRGIVQK